jgi:predicted nucleic acid-binding protein
MKGFIADTGYLIALYDPSDDNRNVSRAKASFRELFEETENSLLLTWPILYETLNTRLSKRMDMVIHIENEWRKLRSNNQLGFIDDQPFREASLIEWQNEIARKGHYRPLSLVDRVLRNAILNPSSKIHALLTFNRKDFEDVCNERSVEIFPAYL